jgi:hypothetical protein
MLDGPNGVESRLVGQRRLLQPLVPHIGLSAARVGGLQLEEQPELHREGQ